MTNNIRRRKSYFEVTRQQKHNQEKTMNNKLKNAQKYASSIGLIIESIILSKISTTTEMRLNKIKIIIKNCEPKYISENEKIFRCLIAKDRANVSCIKYKLIRSSLDFIYMPGINKIISLQKKINAFFPMKMNNYGVYCDPHLKIKYVCQKLLEKNLYVEDKFIIKLSCDGTLITKSSVHLLNFTFTVVNQSNVCKTARGNYILGDRHKYKLIIFIFKFYI